MGAETTLVTRGEHVLTCDTSIDGRVRGGILGAGIVLAAAGIGIIAMLGPHWDLWPDAVVWACCGLGVIVGTVAIVISSGDIRRRIRVDVAAGGIEETILTRFGAVVWERLGFDDCERFGKSHETGSTGERWHLFLVDGRDGSRVPIGSFASEWVMRRTIADITSLRSALPHN